MRSVATADFGSKPAVIDIPKPAPGPGEVLVKVQAASLNGFDVAVAAGYLQGMMEHHFPVVLGKDFAGTVAELGEGVTRFAVGDPVFGVVMKAALGDGSFGEYVVVGDEFGISPIPTGLDVATAGALGLAGTAAYDAVSALTPQPGETVLVSGATGGVGALTIQYVARTGAAVIATAQPGHETDFVRDLGATHAVDHTADLAAQVRAIAPEGVAAVVHLAGDPNALVELLARDGRLASTLGFGPDQHSSAIAVMATPTPATLDQLAADVVEGLVRVPVTRTYTLDEVEQAITEFPGGTLGKLGVSVA